MGVFSDRTSMERILYAVFTYENESAGVYPVPHDRLLEKTRHHALMAYLKD